MAKRPASRSQSLYFTRLSVTNWRNFRRASIDFTRRGFIIGPNASGKSNLLDALRFLRDIARPKGGLENALDADHRRGFSAIRCLEARNPGYLEIDVDVGTEDDPRRWSYRLRLNIRKGEKQPTVIQEVINFGGVFLTGQERPATKNDGMLYSQTLLENVKLRESFEELARFFASIRYIHVVPQIVRDARRHLADADDPFGGDLLRRMKEMPEKSRNARLTQIQAALQIAVPQFRELKLENDSEGRPHLYAAYAHWRPRPRQHSEEVFSDGTLRLIGLLWSISEKGGPLLLEEPELSLHDAVVSQLPSMIARAQALSGRQVIATTHSFAILAAPGIGLDEVHRVTVGDNGSAVERTDQNAEIIAQVIEDHMTVGEAVFALTKPERVEDLASTELVVD